MQQITPKALGKLRKLWTFTPGTPAERAAIEAAAAGKPNPEQLERLRELLARAQASDEALAELARTVELPEPPAPVEAPEPVEPDEPADEPSDDRTVDGPEVSDAPWPEDDAEPEAQH